jgi:WD40 repeat protein
MGPSFIKCFGVTTGRQTLSVSANASSPFAFSPDGKVLALIRPGEGITLIDVMTGREISKITVNVRDEHAFSYMSFSPDGKLLAAASPEGLVLIDPAARKQLFILTDGSVERKESDPE